MSSLPSGLYYISCLKNFAGRDVREDKSLLPKKVECPSAGPHHDLWALERLTNGHYYLRVRGAPTAERNRRLYALLLDGEIGEQWVITRRGTDYTIEKANKSAGWVADLTSDIAHPQIAVRPLSPSKSIPPVYPPLQLWHFEARN